MLGISRIDTFSSTGTPLADSPSATDTDLETERLVMSSKSWQWRALGAERTKAVWVVLAAVMVLFASAANAQIASWTNSSLQSNGSVPATVGTGLLSRGPGLSPSTIWAAYLSSGWGTTSESAAVTANDYV